MGEAGGIPGGDVDRYLAGLTEAERAALERVRSIVGSAAPDATERISYGIPVFAWRGDLVGFAAQKRHLSFYVMSPALAESMADRLTTHKVAGAATIHFTPDDPLPAGLIEEIVAARLVENADRSELE